MTLLKNTQSRIKEQNTVKITRVETLLKYNKINYFLKPFQFISTISIISNYFKIYQFFRYEPVYQINSIIPTYFHSSLLPGIDLQDRMDRF